MRLEDKDIKEFQKIYKKEYGKDIPYKEAQDSAHKLVGLVKLLLESNAAIEKKNARLKDNPKGFPLEEGSTYNCLICHMPITGKEGWWDKYGPKCLACQKAINKRIIPASVAKNNNSWYSLSDLESRFNINRHVMKRFVKEEILKPRIVQTSAGKPHVYLFLVKDNKETLPSKKMTEPKMVSEIKEDGKEWHHLEPWYKFVDPIEYLKGYKIVDYMQYKNIDEKDRKVDNKK